MFAPSTGARAAEGADGVDGVRARDRRANPLRHPMSIQEAASRVHPKRGDRRSGCQSWLSPTCDADRQIRPRLSLEPQAGAGLTVGGHIVQLRLGRLTTGIASNLNACGGLVPIIADLDFHDPAVRRPPAFADYRAQFRRPPCAGHHLRKDHDKRRRDADKAQPSDDPFQRGCARRCADGGFSFPGHVQTSSRAAPAPSAPGKARTTVVITSCEDDWPSACPKVHWA